VVALRAREIDAFLSRPDPARPIVLLYGPDAGLVAERAEGLVARSLKDADDPFSLVRLDGDDLASEPSRLIDEAMTVPLFGGQRVIRVKAGSRNFAAAVETLGRTPPTGCLIVIEAGELRFGAPLRAVCEKSPHAAAIPCYADTERDLARLIDEELKAGNLRIANDARATLLALLGGDRQASRNELRKLALYALGASEVTLDHVLAVVADASALALDPIVDGAFAGRHAELETAFAKAMAAALAPAAIISAAQRQAAQLHQARLAIEGGAAADRVKETVFPKLHFSRGAAIDAALRGWTAARLLRVITQLADASLELRRRPLLARAVAQRALLAVSAASRTRAS
jgi:DNA polymerase-3 subunit delta